MNIIRIPTEEDDEVPRRDMLKSIFHVYRKGEMHKSISPTLDPSKERRHGPTIKEQKVERKEKKERKKSGLPPAEPDDNAYFLHQPYLAFHVPPRVLYAGNTRYTAKPAVLIHGGWFWREYKLQVGPSLALPGVLDPRGVVAWKHDSGSNKARKLDDRKLKGYRVRGWRLWGETGKDYVHAVKQARLTGEGHDPDVPASVAHESKPKDPVVADEAVSLRWSSPLSRQARRYHFQYAGIDFYWKGTGTVKETRKCGLLLRYAHLKLVAKLPVTSDENKKRQPEVCLGKYTSSIAGRKNGTLEFFDTAIVRLVEEHAPSLLAKCPWQEVPGSEGGGEVEEGGLLPDDISPGEDTLQGDSDTEDLHVAEPQMDEAENLSWKIANVKKSTLYHVIVATAMCMIMGEKEKRHTLIDLIIDSGEGAGSAGG